MDSASANRKAKAHNAAHSGRSLLPHLWPACRPPFSRRTTKASQTRRAKRAAAAGSSWSAGRTSPRCAVGARGTNRKTKQQRVPGVEGCSARCRTPRSSKEQGEARQTPSNAKREGRRQQEQGGARQQPLSMFLTKTTTQAGRAKQRPQQASRAISPRPAPRCARAWVRAPPRRRSGPRRPTPAAAAPRTEPLRKREVKKCAISEQRSC